MKNQKELVFTADKVLIAAGRQACLDGVDVGKLGLQLDKRGFIQVDKSSRSEERRVGKECRSRWSPYH